MKNQLDATGNESKRKIIKTFLSEIKIIREAYDNPELEWGSALDRCYAKRKEELKTAEKYLANHPELNDANCSGRGLPAFTAKYLKEYLSC